MSGGETASCPNTSTTEDTKSLCLLTLLAYIPDDLFIVGSVESCSSFEAGIGLSNITFEDAQCTMHHHMQAEICMYVWLGDIRLLSPYIVSELFKYSHHYIS